MGNTISREQYLNEKDVLLIEIEELKKIIKDKDKLLDALRMFRPIDPRFEYIGG